jgi:hypothetical protein
MYDIHKVCDEKRGVLRMNFNIVQRTKLSPKEIISEALSDCEYAAGRGRT